MLHPPLAPGGKCQQAAIQIVTWLKQQLLHTPVFLSDDMLRCDTGPVLTD